MPDNRFVTYNGHEYARNAPMGAEIAQFEQPNYRAENNPYPRMMYKAYKCPDGIVRVESDRTPPRTYFPSDAAYEAAVARDQVFTESCQRIVGRDPQTLQTLSREACEAERSRAMDEGWRDTAEEALAHVRHLEGIMRLAAGAEREFQDQHMSERAKAESRRIQAESPEILKEIPEQPRLSKKDIVSVDGEPKKEHWKTRQARLKKESAA